MAESPQKVESFGGSETPLSDIEQKAYTPGVEEPPLPDLRSRLDLLQAGASIGIPGSTAATLGMFVEDNTTGARLLLTLGSILGRVKTVGDRDVLEISAGTPVLQPGPADGGTESDVVAKVERAVLNEHCDAGVATLIGERRDSDLLLDGGRISSIAVPRLGMRVKAFGRSGLQESTITKVEVTANVGYGTAAQDRRVSGMFAIEKLSPIGYSGAIVLEADTNRAVGLIFAGSAQINLCVPIITVMRELDVRIPGMDAPIEVFQEVVLTDLVALNDTVGYRKPDRLGYETYIESFVRLIRDPETKPPLTIGIYGAWGSGKTFLMARIMERLHDLAPTEEQSAAADDSSRKRRRSDVRLSDVVTVHFNAWEYQASEKLWAGMVQRIYQEVEVHLGLYGRVWVNFRRNLAREAVTLRRVLLPYTLIIGTVLTALTVGLLALGQESLALLIPVLGVPGLIRLAVDMVGIIRQPQSEWIVKFFAQPDYSKHLGFMADIRRDLTALTDSLPPELTIAVFVDDLDRCSPEKAVEVLEAIKLLLDFRRFIVCLGIDARIITHAIEDHYGHVFAAAGVTGYEYLQKIVQIPFNIPEPSFEDIRRFLNNLLGAAQDEVDTLSFEDIEMVTAETVVIQAADAGAGGAESAGQTPVEEDGSTPPALKRDDLENVVQHQVPFIKEERDAFRTFIPFMVPNPRRIKRLVNIYRLIRDLAPDKGLEGIVRQYDKLFPWLLMNEQAPFTTHVMLELFESGQATDIVDLAGLFTKAKPLLSGMEKTRLNRLDIDSRMLAELLRECGTRITRQDIQLLSNLTINFNPALRSEVRAALATVKKEPTPQ